MSKAVTYNRIDELRSYIQSLNDAGVRRTLFYSLAYASLKSTLGEPVQLRRANAQAYLLDNAPLAINPHELIAGSLTEYFPLEINTLTLDEQIQKASHILGRYLEKKQTGKVQKANISNKIRTFEDEFTSRESRWALMSRVYHDANITYEELQSLITKMKDEFIPKGLEPYEIGRELERSFTIDYGEAKQVVNSLPWFAANHLSLDYASIMNKGFTGLISEITALAEKASDSDSKEYYSAALIVAKACSRFMLRYSELLSNEAENVADNNRKIELCAMSVICERLAHDRAKSFREGVQFVWMLHIMASLTWGSALSFGRFDQYMGELYSNDIASGAITKAEAKEILCCMWLKVNEPRMRTVQSLTLGGVDINGNDAANQLTELCLEVVKEMRLPYPNVGVRISKKSPEWLIKSVIESIKEGAGQPMIMNDDIWVDNLRKLGYEDKYANDYYNMGCVEIMIPGKQPNWGTTEPLAFPMLYENIFRKHRIGELSLANFDDFLNAYYTEIRNSVFDNMHLANSRLNDMSGKCFDPLASLMIRGCIERGRDMFQGGSELDTHWSFYAYGLGTAADAMMAVKKHVYDEKTVGLPELAEALKNNFEGYEFLHRRLSNKTPNFGNDSSEVDDLANKIFSYFNNLVFSLNGKDDSNKYVTTMFGYFFHIYHGEITGATPNGRLKGEAFSDSMGPSQGKDVSGPTAMLRSIMKLNHNYITGGYALNIKLNPELVRETAGTNTLMALIKTYLEGGGPQIQFNFVDAQTLVEAKKDPELYRNLIVRIGGYCEYFINLDSALQDEIIERTVHG